MKISLLPAEFTGDPQSVAMLQAFYSRSLEPIEARLERLGGDMASVKKALKRYFVGYGHASIGDCGTLTVFIEGVSILAAKAIQEDRLYNGQETSTRYIELSGELYPSVGNAAQEWTVLQKDLLPQLIDGVRELHPRGEGENEKVWRDATAAKAFDIARAWIPASALTNLSCHMTIRKMNDLTARLRGHPLIEVQEIAVALKNILGKAYPDSCVPEFTEKELEYASWLASDIDAWYLKWDVFGNPLPNDPMSILGVKPKDFEVSSLIHLTEEELVFINLRPRHAPLPSHMEDKGEFYLSGQIDYACWRDLQRHRRQCGAPPMLRMGKMNQWYLDQLDLYLSGSTASAVKDNTEMLLYKLSLVPSGEINDQYRLPIGINVDFAYSFGLAQAIYFAELRAGNTVHPILRPYAQAVAVELEEHAIRVDYDREPARFDIKRGKQTITETL